MTLRDDLTSKSAGLECESGERKEKKEKIA